MDFPRPGLPSLRDISSFRRTRGTGSYLAAVEGIV